MKKGSVYPSGDDSLPPNLEPILDDDRSIRSNSDSRSRQTSESEGEVWIDHPNLVLEPAPVVNPDPNIIPNIESEGDDDSEGAVRVPTRCTRRRRNGNGDQRWTRDGNNRLRRLSNLLGDISKPTDSERKQFACTMGTQSVPAKALHLSRKKSKQKFKQIMARRRDL